MVGTQSLVLDVQPQPDGTLSWSSAHGKSVSSATAKINPQSSWFIYPESIDKVWVYEGSGPLIRVDLSGGQSRVTNVLPESAEFKEVPKPVAERYAKPQVKSDIGLKY
jgi:hypothetical protein